MQLGQQGWNTLPKTRRTYMTDNADTDHDFKAEAVHDYMRSFTSSVSKAAIQSVSCQQKINTRSSSDVELVSFDVFWRK